MTDAFAPTAVGATMRVFQPYPEILAFYDGRIPGVRIHGPQENWLDDGAYCLGICAYAIVSGNAALIYDAHTSIPHARIMRKAVEQRGATSIQMVISHWHPDHIAGLPVFQDCEIIASEATRDMLESQQSELQSRDPAVTLVVMPTRTFMGELDLQVGAVPIQLRQADIHSADSTVMLLPERNLLLATDALEDSVTFVAEPDRLETHLVDLTKMSTWTIDRILPAHGSPDIIAAGGYPRSFIDGTIGYVEKLLNMHQDDAGKDLRNFAAREFADGSLNYFPPYEGVHRRNVGRVLASRAKTQA